MSAMLRIVFLSTRVYPSTLSGLRQQPVYPFGVFPDLVFELGKEANEDAVGGLDALVGGLEGLIHRPAFDASRRQDLEREARLFGLAEHLVHARGVALQVDVAGHLDDLAVQRLFPL